MKFHQIRRSDIGSHDPINKHFQILSTHAVSIAGIDFDNAICELIVEKLFNGQTPKDPHLNSEIKYAAKDAKHQLTEMEKAKVVLSSKDLLICDISLSEVEEKFQSLVDKILHDVGLTVQNAKCSSMDISTVILTGGTSRIPLFIRSIAEMFPHAEIVMSDYPQHDVALGNVLACLWREEETIKPEGTEKCLPKPKIDNVLPWDICVVIKDIYSGDMLNDPILLRNTPIPTHKQIGQYRTESPGQQQVKITITSSEPKSKFIEENVDAILLQATINLKPLEKNATPQVELQANIDNDALLTVEVKDLATGKVEILTHKIENIDFRQ